MATIPILSRFATPHLHLFPTKNPNPSSVFLSLRSSTHNAKLAVSLGLHAPPPVAPIRCSTTTGGGGGGGYEHERAVHPRPQEVPWSKELANSVRLIGMVGAPVQIKHLISGKVLAWTSLGVKKSPTDTTWINLTFWDELALVAFQHVEKGHQVFVSGRLVSDTVEGDDEKKQVYYKVVVQQLNFIERNMPRVSLYEPEANFASSGAKPGGYGGGAGGSTEELWQAFFANPVDWWDNRNNKEAIVMHVTAYIYVSPAIALAYIEMYVMSLAMFEKHEPSNVFKRNPKAPDFKHKDTGEALWVEGKYNPPWVKSQLAILDTRMSSLQPNGSRPSASLMYGDDFLP